MDPGAGVIFGVLEEELFELAPVLWGAEHCAVLPPLLPAHIHDHGPVPPTADAVPALQRPVVGAELTATPFEEPHAPFTGAIGVTLGVTLMENAASAAVAPPSLTPMMIFE